MVVHLNIWLLDSVATKVFDDPIIDGLILGCVFEETRMKKDEIKSFADGTAHICQRLQRTNFYIGHGVVFYLKLQKIHWFFFVLFFTVRILTLVHAMPTCTFTYTYWQ